MIDCIILRKMSIKHRGSVSLIGLCQVLRKRVGAILREVRSTLLESLLGVLGVVVVLGWSDDVDLIGKGLEVRFVLSCDSLCFAALRKSYLVR